MPAYWIKLPGVEGAPIGLGVTASDLASAFRLLDEASVRWHRQAAQPTAQTIEAVEELGIKAFDRLNLDIARDGVWFPVIDEQVVMRSSLDMTVELREADSCRLLREQLKTRGFDPGDCVVYGLGAGNREQEVTYLLVAPEGTIALSARWNKTKLASEDILELHFCAWDALDEGPSEKHFDIQSAILRRIVAGDLRATFERMVVGALRRW